MRPARQLVEPFFASPARSFFTVKRRLPSLVSGSIFLSFLSFAICATRFVLTLQDTRLAGATSLSQAVPAVAQPLGAHAPALYTPTPNAVAATTLGRRQAMGQG
jgi:ABC-type phosphate/phosphonate transport system permease subunit